MKLAQHSVSCSISILQCLLLSLLFSTAVVRAVEIENQTDGILSNLGVLPLQDQQLDLHRGGFVMPDGMMISLGIADLIMIDGALFAEQSWQIAPATLQQLSLGDITTGVSSGLSQSIIDNSLLQQGGLSVSSMINAESLAMTTLIQNSQDNRIIETFRTINIDISQFGSISNHVGIGSSYLWRSPSFQHMDLTNF